ncbi:hypothetical protein TTHERM_01179940 (macronuclear) [Tetrahymena thermophila SB210]|uniref:Uncharacterized protein n=1 Tax=Tetrahymena thermophila (strain SB210) TaxID=312017 RepID=Q22AN1_TETTS|nr:hypothetical protein TTHERM_01179940 [Tetrahymena thermophila SB210]EAR82363.1 hypothetical protein TTHERM_01179940 [Tetrahymena thermophila SB210]|eukprot:XP_001030026.1 hypothetical protein TTHERM_01179940 [Tetrahymena thermophila SB210]
MVSVQKIVQYYSQFFQSVVYEQVKHSDKIMTEWQYFSQLMSKEPLDYNRIQTYLDIISLNKNKQDHSLKKKQTNTPNSFINIQNQNSQNQFKLKLNTEENIDTDFDENDNSPSSRSSCSENNRERQILVFKNDDDDESENNQDDDGELPNQQNQNFFQQLEGGEEEIDQDNIMIIERKCFDDELNNFQQNPIYTSTSPTVQKSSEKDDYKKGSQSKINQVGMVLTPNTSKNIQQQKFSFYSNDQSLKTHESSNSPILKEVTSNFQNIKTTPHYNKSSQSNQNHNGLGKQLANNHTSQFTQNTVSSANNNQNNENIYISQNDVSKNYNINFKISPQLSKENSNQQSGISSTDIQKQQQQQQFSSSLSTKNNKMLTPSLSHFSITNKSLKNILQETTQHTKSLEQNIEMMEAQPNNQYCVIATPQATEQGSGYKKKNQSKQFNYNNNKIVNQNQTINKVESKHLKTQPSPSPAMFNIQPPVQPVCHTSNSQSSLKDFTIQDFENKEQQFQQVSQNQEQFESVSERKSLIKIVHNKIPFQESVNQPLLSIKPPFTPTEDNKMKREFNNLYLRKQIADIVTFFEGNSKKIDEVVEKIQNNQQQQQQGILQYQQNFNNNQLGLAGGQQFHRLGLSSNQMTPQSINPHNFAQLPSHNFQPFPQVSKQASQIQLFFQPTPPPAPAPPHSAHSIQNQQQQQIQQLYGYQQNQPHQQINQAFQQYQQRSTSQHNGVSNLYPQQPIYPANFIQQNNQQMQQQQQQQYNNIAQISRQNIYQPPLIPIKQASCPRGSSENNGGGRSLSTYSRDTSDGQVKTMFKRMRTYDICTNTQNSSQIPSSVQQQKNLNRTMDENINNSNNVSCMNLNTSKLNANNQTGLSNANNVSCNLNYSNNENNRYLTNSTNQLAQTNQNSSQELQQRKRSEYSFPDLKSFNKYIKK